MAVLWKMQILKAVLRGNWIKPLNSAIGLCPFLS